MIGSDAANSYLVNYSYLLNAIKDNQEANNYLVNYFSQRSTFNNGHKIA